MILLNVDELAFSFPEVHPQATLEIEFHRTLRIPDDGKDYPLPPGLGKFAVRDVDDFEATVPQTWIEHGGVMLPMYQSEALWLRFASRYIDSRRVRYPFAVKIAAGKIKPKPVDPAGEGGEGGERDRLVRDGWGKRRAAGSKEGGTRAVGVHAKGGGRLQRGFRDVARSGTRRRG